jgi:hypothetical protein
VSFNSDVIWAPPNNKKQLIKGISKIPRSIDAVPREVLQKLACPSLWRAEWAIFEAPINQDTKNPAAAGLSNPEKPAKPAAIQIYLYP